MMRREGDDWTAFDFETLVIGFGPTAQEALLDLAAEHREQYERLCELGEALSGSLRDIRDLLAVRLAISASQPREVRPRARPYRRQVDDADG